MNEAGHGGDSDDEGVWVWFDASGDLEAEFGVVEGFGVGEDGEAVVAVGLNVPPVARKSASTRQ